VEPSPGATERPEGRLPALADLAARHGLFVAGIAPLRPEALLAPDEPGFWPLFSAAPEHADGRPDPLDRWSRRVIGRMACTLKAKAVFPFGGLPWRPFIDWARRSGRAWSSPVGLLVHDTAGLWISYRGGILLTEEAPFVDSQRPCDACLAPCLSACPVGALGAQGYDVPACHAFLDTGPDCLQGCRVRCACPVGASRRSPEQSAFHMKAFHPR
jgi:hypothetical protein